MESIVTPEIVEKMRDLKEVFIEDSVVLLGYFETPESETSVDIFYRLFPDFWEKMQGKNIFSLFKKIKDKMEDSLGITVDLLDIGELGPIDETMLPDFTYLDDDR